MGDILLWAIDRIIGWRTVEKQARLRAIDGLTPAVSASVVYTTRLLDGMDRDSLREDQLYILWSSASSMVSDFDSRLAQDCLQKAKYWLMPLNYSVEKVDELNIRLVRMQAELERLKHKR
jgi:uncharacterized small protein (DUF1192 family)